MSLQFDQSLKNIFPNNRTASNIQKLQGEAVRLYNEIKGHPSGMGTDAAGNPFVIPERKGIDVLTATFAELKDFLDNPIFDKSESSRSFVRRMMAIRFPTDFAIEKNIVSADLKNEYQLIEDNKLITTDWLGEVGFHGKVRLDGSLKSIL